MSADALATVLILISAVFHAASNALVKAGEDKFVVRAILLGTCSVISLPFVFVVPFPSVEIWWFIALSVAIHFIYDLFLVNAYRFGDLSLVYPVLRGIAPVLTAIGAYLFLSEVLPPVQVAALVLLSFGILLFAFERKVSPTLVRESRVAIGFALATGVTIALYTLVDATAMRRVPDAATYIFWFFLFNGLAFSAFVAVWRGRQTLSLLKTHAKGGILSGVLGFVSYTLALLALRFGQTAEVAALRETSVVFGALIGTIFLAESFGRRRVFAAGVIAVGAVVLKAG